MPINLVKVLDNWLTTRSYIVGYVFLSNFEHMHPILQST